LNRFRFATNRYKKNELIYRLLPFLAWSHKVSANSLRSDLMAGLTGAVIVLPQGVAYAMIAGLPPVYGLYTAMITAIVAALFGSSRHLISGPTAAISIVVLSVVQNLAPPGSAQFIAYVLTLTFVGGVIQLLLGLARLGTLVNFISHTVLVGFTVGAAVLIALSQLQHVLGPTTLEGFKHLISMWWGSLSAAGELAAGINWTVPGINWIVPAIALVTMASTLLVQRLLPRWPNMLIGMLAGSAFCWLVNGESHGVIMVGGLPSQLPSFSLPDISFENIRLLAPGALAVAMLGLIEAVSIAKSLGMKSKQCIDSNQEFIGQGLSNIVGSLFSCYMGSGSFTRSGANYDAGAQTPLAAVFAAMFLLLILMLIPGLTAYLPVPVMAGAIVLIAYRLIDLTYILHIIKTSRREAVIMTVTFISTLWFDLEFAIYVGVLVSLVLYLQRTSRPVLIELQAKLNDQNEVVLLSKDDALGSDNLTDSSLDSSLDSKLKVIRLDGSLYFAAIDYVQQQLRMMMPPDSKAKHLLIIASGMNFIDIAGAEMLVGEAHRLSRRGGGLYLCRLKQPAMDVLNRGGYMAALGEGDQHVFNKAEDALQYLHRKI
jgi:sulfate permease, SulP family